MKHERDIEQLLERLSPRPAPPGLKERTLRAAGQKIRERCLLTPVWRWFLATTLAFLFLFVLADWRTSTGEQIRLSALLDLPVEKDLSPESRADSKAAELLANFPDLDAASRELMRRFFLEGERAAARSGQSARRFREEIHEY